MKRLIRSFLKRFKFLFVRFRIVRFVVCGGISLLLHHAVLLILYSGFGNKFWVSAGIGYVCGWTLDFFLQKKITFENRDYKALHLGSQGALFYFIRSVNLGNYLLITHLLNPENPSWLYVLCLSAAVVMILGIGNFFFDKYVTFRNYEKFSWQNLRDFIKRRIKKYGKNPTSQTKTEENKK